MAVSLSGGEKRLVWQRGDKLKDLDQFSRDACGVAVIITNDYHQTDPSAKLSRLDGTTTDGDKMGKAFEFFGFVCIRAKNLLAEDITELVKIVTSCEALANCKCIAFIFSGHGKQGAILGEDNDIYSGLVDIEDDIIKPLTNAPFIAKAPKLFFIDACRGNEGAQSGKDSGKESDKDAGPITWRSAKLSKGDEDSGSSHSAGNFIIGYATMTGYKSYLRGDSAEGSIWMPLLADELQRNPDRGVVGVLQDVNSRLSNEYKNERIKKYQQPHFESTCPEKVNLFKISGKQACYMYHVVFSVEEGDVVFDCAKNNI